MTIDAPQITTAYPPARSVTVVSCLFDLGAREGNPDRQGVAFYVEHARPLLALDVPMVIYLDRHLVDPATGGIVGTNIRPRPNLQIIPIALEETAGFLHLPAITAARTTHPFHRCNAAKDTPLYHVFQRAKYELLARGAEANPFGTSHIAWIDFGIAKAVPLDHAMDALAQAAGHPRPTIVVSDRLEPVRDFRELRQRVSAGFIAGPCPRIAELCRGLLEHADRILTEGYAPHDETLIEDFIARTRASVRLRHADHHSRIFADCQPLLGLVMIVKNEAHGIASTLATAVPHVDRVTILETGSTDGTMDVLRRELAPLGDRARIFAEPFVDFSTTRNRALDLHDEHLPTVFSLMMDADDHLIGSASLRVYLETQRESRADVRVHDAYGIRIRRPGEASYDLPLVRRTRAKHRYNGRVHECSPIHTSTLPAQIEIRQERPAQSAEASKRRWVRDLAILCEDLERTPGDPRALFYLAQTQECLGLAQSALDTYELRIAVPPHLAWREETYEAMMRRAALLKTTGKPWSVVMEAYLEAHAFDPRRAEPLYQIAEHYRIVDHIPLAYLFAHRAAQLPVPAATLFVDRDVYAWKAHEIVAITGFYLGGVARESGRAAADAAIRGNSSNDHLRTNRSFYTRSAADLYGARLAQIQHPPEAPYVPTNPSVHYDPIHKRWRCIVRTTNYRIVNGQYLTPDDNVIFTKNVLLELDDDLSTRRAIPMIDCDPTPRSDYPVHGYEDCRLFQVGKRLYATATVCDFTPDGRREIVLLILGPGYQIEHAVPIRGPWSVEAQKNWMPLASRDSFPIPIVYAALPTLTLNLQGDRADPDGMISGASLPVSGYPQIWKHGRLRGGSQVVQIDPETYLCLVHDVTFSGSARTYLHRFVQLDKHLHAERFGDLFYFQKLGIEFCAGLAYDPDTGRLVASFGVDDSSASFAIFNVQAVMKSLRADAVI